MKEYEYEDLMLRMRLKSIRKSKGLSQKELADKSGLSVATIANIESDKETTFTMKSMLQYLTALEYEIDINKKVRDNGDTEGSDKELEGGDRTSGRSEA